MAPRAIEIYQSFGTLEWCNKYFIKDGVSITPSSLAAALVNAQKPLQCAPVSYTRYRYLDAAGSVVAEGTLTGVGTATGDMMPIHYAILVRITGISNVKRPSVKYIHGFTESWNTNGVWQTAGNTALAAYATALNSNNVCDSDNLLITDAVFRGFSRRKRMRVMGT